MNRKQKFVLGIGGALFVFSLLCPPWQYVGGSILERSADFRCICQTPQNETSDEIRNKLGLNDRFQTLAFSARRDVVRLLIQLFAIFFVTVGLALLLIDGSETKREFRFFKLAGAVSFFIGALFSAAYVLHLGMLRVFD